MIKIIYFLPNISMRKNNRRLYLNNDFVFRIFWLRNEILDFNRIFCNGNEKYTFYQKLCLTKFVGLFQVNNFAFQHFFRISHIMVANCNFRFSIVFF